MKENSIEEDINLLKDFTEGNFKRDKLENYKGSYKMGYFYYKDIQQAIEHLLSDYKRVLKENEEKDKIIDLLIKELYTKAHISTRCYLQTSTEECMKYKNCYECLKKHFEKKAKGLK